MKKILLLGISLAIATPSFTQPPPVGTITVSFQPDATIGEDAAVFKTYDQTGIRDCIPFGSPQTPASTNYGNDPEFMFSAWTYNQAGCPTGTTREFIRFSELNTIPPDASIASAFLILRGPATSTNYGNNLYPGTPALLNNDNSGWVSRVLPGSADAWNEGTITWNNQPNTDPISGNWVGIPITQSRWGWTQVIDVTTMVADIVQELQTDPDANNGFMLALQNEVFYRMQLYASSDHPDPALWPELRVTYSDCHSGFGYCVTSDQSSVYNFTATNNLVNYEWLVDWSPVGNGPTLNYDFNYTGTSAGSSHTVCLTGEGTDGEKCQRCLEVCGSNYIKIGNKDNNGNVVCDPVFTYCASTPNTQNYTFTAQNQSYPFYNWLINGTVVGTSPTLNYSFPIVGDYEIELRAGPSSTFYCFSLIKHFCVSPVYLYEGEKPSKPLSGEKPLSSLMVPGDDPMSLSELSKQVTISPNPSTSGWNVNCSLTESDLVTITLFDFSGKQIKSMTVKGNKGNNKYYLPASEVAPGIYFIETKGEHLNIKQKAAKQ